MIDRELKVIGLEIMSVNEEEQKKRPGLCRCCLLYDECEMVEEYTQFGDYHFELENGCIMDRQHVNQIACGSQKVTDGIGDHFKIEIKDDNIEEDTVDRWEPLQPVFISAQTGQGKNYFIENTLIPYVRKMNYREQTDYKVLILSNRLALKQQVKNHLEGNDDSGDEDNKIYSYKDVAHVMTYQGFLHQESILRRKQKEERKRYIYVICDEAHFFTSDAMFNPHTERILLTIVDLFQNAIRVYMSATPYDCLEYIIHYERLRFQNKYKEMAFYHFKRDYSYLDVKAYSSINELYGEIVETVSREKEKWLIFIDDKKACEKVKKELVAYAEKNRKSFNDGNVFTVDANSKKNDVYQEIVNKEKLGKDTFVLISTSVLDNGINLTGITHIVVSDMDKTKCLQMVGRARRDESSSRKTLYIKRFGTGEVNKKITELKKQQDAYHSYELAYRINAITGVPEIKSLTEETKFFNKYYNGKDEDWRDAKHWFVRGVGKPMGLFLNGIAKSLSDQLIFRYSAVLNEMENGGLQTDNKLYDQKEQIHIGQKYLEYQLLWFGKEYCENDDITFSNKKKAKEDFLDFLKSYVGNEIGKEDKNSFMRKFAELHDRAFGREDKNKGRTYGINKMNKILKNKEVNYKVVSSSGCWMVQKCDWKTEKS